MHFTPSQVCGVLQTARKHFATVTEPGRRYLTPLVLGEAYPPFKNGVPDCEAAQRRGAKKLTRGFAVRSAHDLMARRNYG
jgi:hypothetical protein